jgi:hypothetical protein
MIACWTAKPPEQIENDNDAISPVLRQGRAPCTRPVITEIHRRMKKLGISDGNDFFA